jgi:DNA uptake protein ComE-like DNA-binding protein
MVLYAILVITAMATMIAASTMFRMQAEVAASASYVRTDQSWSAAYSGVKHAMNILSQPPSEGGNYDNPDIYADQLVCSESGDDWYFTIYAFNEEDDEAVRYGVTDTASKINVNSAPRKTLEALPEMTPELVDCLIDFRDSDNEPQENGAEQEYYNQLTHPYSIRNGSLTSIEELLLIKGFNGTLVYGEDANFNTLLDANEDDGDESHPDDNSDGMLNRGLRSQLTVMSYQLNVDSGNQKQININGSISSSKLRNAVGASTAEFIEFCRKGGKKFTHPSELLNMSYTATTSSSGGSRRRRGRGSSSPKTETRSSPVKSASSLARVLDKLTVSSAPVSMGQVNVNTASPEVLLAVLGSDNADMVDRIIGLRADLDPEESATIAWLYGNDIVGAEAFKKVAPMLCARGFQYRVQVIGFGIKSGRYCVLEAIIDLASRTPRVLYLRDLTGLGVPFPLENLQERVGD